VISVDFFPSSNPALYSNQNTIIGKSKQFLYSAQSSRRENVRQREFDDINLKLNLNHIQRFCFFSYSFF